MIPAAMFRTCVSYELKLVGFRASSPSYKNEMDVNLWFLFLWFPDRPKDGIFYGFSVCIKVLQIWI